MIRKITPSVKFYIACLIPITYASFNVNYFFLVMHGFRSHRKLRDIVIVLFAIYLPLCYVLGLFTTIPLGTTAVYRQILSFGAFLVPWTILFIKFNSQDIMRLLRATVYAAVFYSLWVLFITIIINSDILQSLADQQSLKEALRPYVWAWPQYYAPVLVFAFIVVLARAQKKLLHYASLVILIVCIYFTSTRAAYFALFLGVLMYFLITLKNLIEQKNTRATMKLIVYAAIPIIVFFVFFRDTPIYSSIEKQSNRTITAITNFVQNNNPVAGSDSLRTSYWKFAIELLFKTNPLTGIGFAGIYVFPQVQTGFVYPPGSLDSQFFDSLFKLGIIGTCFILYCFFKLIKYFYKADIGVCCAIFSLFIYGLFHTTYASPYIGVILFSLLSFVDSQTAGISFINRGAKKRL